MTIVHGGFWFCPVSLREVMSRVKKAIIGRFLEVILYNMTPKCDKCNDKVRMCHCFTHLNLCNLVFLMLSKSDATFSIFPPDLSCKFTHFHMHSGSLSFSTMSCVSFKRPHIPADIKRHRGAELRSLSPSPKTTRLRC